MIHHLDREQVVRRRPDDVFAFFADARNLAAITPPWLRFEILTPGTIAMRAGTLIEYRLRVRGVPLRWVSRIEAWEPGRRFVDLQTRGPYRLWRHVHTFGPHPDGTLTGDHVEYALPLGALGAVAHAAVRRDLTRIFDYRREAVARLLG